MRVTSFEPLQTLERLELLHLTNIKAEDESLMPLGKLTNLKRLDIANFYRMSEFARLAHQLRSTECTWFKPFVEIKHSQCDACAGSRVLLTGNRKPTLCMRCDQEKLDRHIGEWGVYAR
jgi:hypothetical protein